MAFRLISRQSIKDLNKSISMFSRGLTSEGGELGSGAGKGGGSGGSIRDAGGAFGKQEAAREEEYFRKKQKEQLEGLKLHLHEEIETNQELIKKHQEAIAKAKKKIEELTHHN